MEDVINTGYTRALKAAGFNVIDFMAFGDWQGTWFAFVQLNGEYGFIIDSYGSCGGCDAFQADCDDTPEGLKAFGERYKDQIQSFDQALQYAKRNSDWDQEANEMVEWVESHQYGCDFEKLIKEDK